jgi:hypothetical protein
VRLAHAWEDRAALDAFVASATTVDADGKPPRGGPWTARYALAVIPVEFTLGEPEPITVAVPDGPMTLEAVTS